MIKFFKRDYFRLSENNFLFISIITLIIISSKWFFSSYYFDESIEMKLILDNPDGNFYYSYTKFLADLNFIEMLSIESDHSIAGEVFGSLILHAFLYKLLGYYGLVVGDYIFIFLFLYLFYKILIFLNFTKFISIFISLLIFNIPSLIDISFLNDFIFLQNFKSISGFAYPNPLVSNLFFYVFIYFIFKIEKNYILNYKNIFILGTILSITFVSFYYYFVVQVLTFFFLVIYKEKRAFFSNLKNKILLLFFLICIFLIFTSPYTLMLFFAEPDYLERVGSIIIDNEQKNILFLHYGKKFSSLLFIIVLLVNFLITLSLRYLRSNNLTNKIVLDLLLLSSIISPLLFVQFSPTISNLYHFNLTIFICLFLSLFLGFVFCIKSLPTINFMLNFNTLIKSCLVLSLLSVNAFHFHKEYKRLNLNEDYKEDRSNLSIVTNEIIKNKTSKSILTFDNDLMIWSILNDFDNVILTSGVLTSDTNKKIENDLFKTFKYLGLDENDFLEIFRNKKKGWRFLNSYTQKFFWFKYTATSLKTYNNSENFLDSELKFIKKTSPLHAQSLAIPIFEFDRLKQDFIKANDIFTEKPEYIVITDKEMINMIDKNFTDYCYIEDSKTLIFLRLKKSQC